MKYFLFHEFKDLNINEIILLIFDEGENQ